MNSAFATTAPHAGDPTGDLIPPPIHRIGFIASFRQRRRAASA